MGADAFILGPPPGSGLPDPGDSRSRLTHICLSRDYAADPIRNSVVVAVLARWVSPIARGSALRILAIDGRDGGRFTPPGGAQSSYLTGEKP